MSSLGLTRAFLLVLACLAAGCGKKGAPLAPLYLVPAAVTDVSARRVDDGIRLRFVLPASNVNGPGIDLDRVEVYAVTVAPGEETPPNRELLTRPYLAGLIQVKPPPADGAPAAPEDTRPAPGEIARFVEQLSTLPPAPPRRATQKPAVVAPGGAATPQSTTSPPGSAAADASTGAPVAVPPTPAAAPKAGTPPTQTGAPKAGSPPPGGAPATQAPKVTQPVRIYVIRGVARSGRSGPASPRLAVPLGPAPDAPGGLRPQNTEKGIVLDWLPAVASIGGASPTYNVYRADAAAEPLNPKPLATPSYEQPGAELGTELCFHVRSVEAAGPVLVESALSPPACVTPKDSFPPAAPKGLATISMPGAVQLIWDANTDPDLAGYIVLRAEAPDETLQPLTPAPIRDTVFKDASVKPGVRYQYAIVAVDSATPPNRSTPSERAEAIAR